MNIKWNLKISDQGLLQIYADINNHQIYVSFQTPPTYITIVEHNDKDATNVDIGDAPKGDTKTKIIIYSDGKLIIHCPKDISLYEKFMYVPDGYRYGTYFVQGNNVLYKKDFWNYASVGYYKNDKPVLRSISPRNNVQYKIIYD